MKGLFKTAAAVILALSAVISCDDGWKMPDEPVDPSEKKTGPTDEQLAAISDFVTIAIATDDYLASIESGDESFTITTFSGKSVSVPIHIDVVPEGGSVSGLQNYVIDGARYAEFCLGGETQTLPSDIHQWYNPPLVMGNGTLNALFIGGGSTWDSTMLLPGLIKGSGSTGIRASRLIKDGMTLDDFDISTEYSLDNSSVDSDKWAEAGNVTAGEVLAAEPWDVVAIMEDPLKAATGQFDRVAAERIDDIVGDICRTCSKKRPTILMMLPPSFPSQHSSVVENFGGDRNAMDDAITAYGRKVTTETLIFDVIPVGMAIRDARGSELFAGNELTCDGTGLDRGAGAYIAACTIFCKIIESCTELKLTGNSLTAISGSNEPGQVATSVNTTNLALCRNAAKYAVLSPYEFFNLDSLHSSASGEGLPEVGFDDTGIVLDDGDTPDPVDPVDPVDPAAARTLSFDFATQISGLMPKGHLAAEEINSYASYHSFKLKAEGTSTSCKFYNAGGCYHADGKAYTTIYDGKSTGYLGLPAMKGYKLSGITAERVSATGATVKLEILSDVASHTVLAGPYTWNAGNANPPAITLSGTKENTVYWIHSLDNTYVPISRLTLKYEPAGSADAHAADYDIFLLIGQSNMAGRGIVSAGDCGPEKDVYIFTSDDETVIYGAQPLYNVESTIRKSIKQQKFNLAGPFAAAVAKATGRKVLIVLNARGETQIEAWLKGGSAGNYTAADDEDKQGKAIPSPYDEAVRRALAAKKYGTLRGVIWHQGEGNANEGQVPYYMAKLKQLASDLRTDLGMTSSQLPFIVGELNYAYAWAGNLNPVLNSVVTEIPNSACASAESCGANDDNVHFSTQGLTLLGERYAQKYLQLAGK